MHADAREQLREVTKMLVLADRDFRSLLADVRHPRHEEFRAAYETLFMRRAEQEVALHDDADAETTGSFNTRICKACGADFEVAHRQGQRSVYSDECRRTAENRRNAKWREQQRARREREQSGGSHLQVTTPTTVAPKSLVLQRPAQYAGIC